MGGVFVTRALPREPDVMAPDGSEVRILSATGRGSMAQFRLPPGAISKAMVHKTVDELWYFTHGSGRIWRKSADQEEVKEVMPGLSISIPVGTSFQFRCDGDEALCAIGVTMPPWPGEDEAQPVAGLW